MSECWQVRIGVEVSGPSVRHLYLLLFSLFGRSTSHLPLPLCSSPPPCSPCSRCSPLCSPVSPLFTPLYPLAPPAPRPAAGLSRRHLPRRSRVARRRRVHCALQLPVHGAALDAADRHRRRQLRDSETEREGAKMMNERGRKRGGVVEEVEGGGGRRQEKQEEKEDEEKEEKG